MSDLQTALQDEVDAYRPDAVPPFAGVLQRRRRDKRRRTAAVALTVVAVSGTATVASSVLRPTERVAPLASGSQAQTPSTVPTAIRYVVSPDETVTPGWKPELEACLNLPGVVVTSETYPTPETYRNTVTVTGAPELASAFRQCINGVPGYVVERNG